MSCLAGVCIAAEAPTSLPSLPEYNLGSGSIHATPGVEGDVWITTGKALYHSTDSGKSYASLANVEESNALGMGKAPPGNTYPTLYLIGKVGGVSGFFRSHDVGISWSRINDDQHQFGFAGVITGDPRIYGRVYVGAERSRNSLRRSQVSSVAGSPHSADHQGHSAQVQSPSRGFVGSVGSPKIWPSFSAPTAMSALCQTSFKHRLGVPDNPAHHDELVKPSP